MASTTGLASPARSIQEAVESTTQSPPSSPRHTRQSMKVKKPPPITPKRFTRFFTPRPTSASTRGSAIVSRAGRQLRDITRNGLNRRAHPRPRQATTPKKTVLFAEGLVQDENLCTPQHDSGRKRKAPPTPPDSSPIQPLDTPSKKLRFTTRRPDFDIREDEEAVCEASSPPVIEEEYIPTPIQRVRAGCMTSRVLQRSFGGLHISRGRRVDHCVSDWRHTTADYCSTAEDIHALEDTPFCVAACNTNSLIAIGGEEGGIRLLESDAEVQDFNNPHLIFRPHDNAIMDMSFSSDDLTLATASGDQTARIIDMRTQSTTYVLAKHYSSVKQIRFQPGNDKVLATSSRDGCVQIWDLRCSGSSSGLKPVLSEDAQFGTAVNSMNDAHSSRNIPAPASLATRDIAGKGESQGRRGDVSITSLSFLPTGRENFLLTASDASSVIKLWDIRARYSRRGQAIAISATRQPESHSKHRQYGVNSLCLNTDGSRIYALSRDNTIYAYSTSHLVLGNSDVSNAARTRPGTVEKDGIGPLYGFRHPRCYATSFYVKASLRRATADRPEMLAVGSTGRTPVLFPTDESMLSRTPSHSTSILADDDDIPPSYSPLTPTLPSSTSPFLNSSAPFPNPLTARKSQQSKDTIPIYNSGTPLVRGHDKEVSSVVWSHTGELVTVGDDRRARRWREDDETARGLRVGGEEGGRRWGCGWADIGTGWKGDEDGD